MRRRRFSSRFSDPRPKALQSKEEVCFMTKYALPALDYDYGALEPHISGALLEVHHSKHHAAYVEQANQTLEKLDEARDAGDFTRLAALERALAFNLSGHVLHSIFWRNLAPTGGGKPSGELARAIDRDFGGFEKMQAQLTHVASTVMGSGWAALMYEPLAGRLITSQIYDHQSNVSQGAAPLLVIDAWEHAYYLQYKNQKLAFFQAVWNLWNWYDVEARFSAAATLDLRVPETVAL
jgi:Fe-Mn family superoxide dismutase